MGVDVSPELLRGRVEPYVRRAVLDGTAIPTPEMQSQGDMRRLLADHDRLTAVRRGFTSLSTDVLKADLDQALADRDGELYRRQPEFAEHVEDRIDDLEVELARRDALRWTGL